MMTTISLEMPTDLAQRLAPLKPHLAEILELGLRYWEDNSSPLTPRQQVEQLWATNQLIVPLDTTLLSLGATTTPASRSTPIKAGGKPASQIIIEQRGTL